MSDSREESPDWLRSFEPPTRSAIELSSGSESPLDHSPVSDDEDGINLSKLFNKKEKEVSDISDQGDAVSKTVQGKSPKKNGKVKRTPEKKRKNEDDSEREGKRAKGEDINRRTTPEKHGESHEQKHSVWSLSSDSECSQDTMPVGMGRATKRELSENEEDTVTENKKEIDGILIDKVGKSPKPRASKVKSPLKRVVKEDEKTSKTNYINGGINGENDANGDFVKEDISGKHSGPQGLSSRLPLLLSEKVQRTKALVECEGDSIDLSGDMGSVGRIVISDDPLKNHEMLLDLKGTIYKTTIVPSRTFCVVSFGHSEAKIEAIMNDYIQLKPQSNVYEAETMVEGTLDGFSFDSEDEADKAPAQADQQEPDDEQPDGKSKRKADKPSGAARKKAKPAGGKAPKNMKKKPQASKKGKTKK